MLEEIYKAFDTIAEQMFLMRDLVKTSVEAAQQAETTPAPQPQADPDPEPEATLDELKARLSEFVLKDQAANQARLAQILAKYGARNVSGLNPSDYAAVLAEIQE